jgi:hypothetical protein
VHAASNSRKAHSRRARRRGWRRLGKIEIRGSEIILGPPLKFTKANIDKFNFDPVGR